jgi:outer membrane biosynthesis protein TonB
MVSEEQSNDPGDGVPTGDNAAYRGGDMAQNGVRNQGPVRNAQVDGQPGGTGTAPTPPPGPDLSAAARVEDVDESALEGFFPDEARDEGITDQVVVVSLTIEPDGRISAARAANDPGHGFARAAERAALSGAFSTQAARDREGRAIRSTIRWRIRFQLSS